MYLSEAEQSGQNFEKYFKLHALYLFKWVMKQTFEDLLNKLIQGNISKTSILFFSKFCTTTCILDWFSRLALMDVVKLLCFRLESIE